MLYNVRPIRAKDRAFLDVIVESVNNPLRFLFGWFAVKPHVAPPVSILLAYWFGGAFLMAAKRVSEHRAIVEAGGTANLAAYRPSFAVYTQSTLVTSCLVYAQGFAFMMAIFLLKYRIEYLVVIPLFIALFAAYMRLALTPDLAAARPEELMRQPAMLIGAAVTMALFGVLTFVDLPWLNGLTSSDLHPSHPGSLTCRSPARLIRRVAPSGSSPRRCCSWRWRLLDGPIWLVRLVPTQDGPVHLAQADLIARFGWGGALQEPAASFYQWNPHIEPNSAIYLLLARPDPADRRRADRAEPVLQPVPANLVAASSVVSRSETERPILPMLLLLPIAFGVFIHWGFYNFALGVPLFLLFASVLARAASRARRRNRVRHDRIIPGSALPDPHHIRGGGVPAACGRRRRTVDP